MKRGDVVLVRFPHPSGQRGKKRPAVVVQSDAHASTVSTVVVAEVPNNLTLQGDPACLFRADDGGHEIIARSVEVVLGMVYYYDRGERLQPGERIAEWVKRADADQAL